MGKFERKLTAWEKKLSKIKDPFDRSLVAIAFAWRKEVSASFDRERDPNTGRMWKRRTRPYAWKALKKTRKLRRSWRVKSNGFVIRFSNSDSKKALWHQHGTKNPDGSPRMPARAQAPIGKLPPRYRKIAATVYAATMSDHFKRVG